jgi:hypothetical protein
MLGRPAENSTKWGCGQGSLVPGILFAMGRHERVAQYILGGIWWHLVGYSASNVACWGVTVRW